MIYLYIGENPTDKTEINTISFIVPENLNLYKAIEEKDLPEEKEGHYRQLYYNKTEDTVIAEYKPTLNTKEELLKEKIDEQEERITVLSDAINEMLLEA